MARSPAQSRIGAIAAEGRRVWLTADDRWTADPAEAELIEDEAHAAIRLIEAARAASGLHDVHLIEGHGPHRG